MGNSELSPEQYNAYLEEFTFLSVLEHPLNAAASESTTDSTEPSESVDFPRTPKSSPLPFTQPNDHPRANGLSDFLKKKHRIRNETERLRDFVEANDLRKIRNRKIALSEHTRFAANIIL